MSAHRNVLEQLTPEDHAIMCERLPLIVMVGYLACDRSSYRTMHWGVRLPGLYTARDIERVVT